MPHTNRAGLNRLFANFCRFWTKGLHATVQMKTTGSGGVMAQFEFELEKPNEIFPTGPAGFRRGQPQGEPRQHPDYQPGSAHASGHPGATGGRCPRRRGPKVIEHSRMRAAAHQASLAAARCTASTTAIPTPPPKPPPTGPTSTRLIKVVTRRTSFRSSFSQLDGQDSSVDESACSARWQMRRIL